MKKEYYQLDFLISTCFGIGKIPFAPGTFGSLLAIPFYYLFLFLVLNWQGPFAKVLTIATTNYMLLISVILFFTGVIYSSLYSSRISKEDPSEIVIDEFVGQLLTIICCIFMLPSFTKTEYQFLQILGVTSENVVYFTIFIAFILFRFFDIIKPWPIDYVDNNVKGGLGIMLDDIIAATFAIISFYLLIFTASDIFQKFF